MKSKFFVFGILVLITGSLSSCYVDYEVAAPYVEVNGIYEYEDKEVIRQHWENGHLVYEEAIYRAMIDIDLSNTGGVRARNVSVEVTLFDRYGSYTTVIPVSNLYPGESTTISFDTGYEFVKDYYDVEVLTYWD